MQLSFVMKDQEVGLVRQKCQPQHQQLLEWDQVFEVALLTDGRFSGASRGISVGHISPEAAAGGMIALLEQGDIVCIDVEERLLEVRVSDEELEKRKKNGNDQNRK